MSRVPPLYQEGPGLKLMSLGRLYGAEKLRDAMIWAGRKRLEDVHPDQREIFVEAVAERLVDQETPP